MPMFQLAAAALFTCASPQAVDGDTLRCGAGVGLVRLIGIDAPELPGHCARWRQCTPGDGEAARGALRSLIAGRAVRCESSGRDVFNRVLARCSAGGIDLSCAMIARGAAVPRYRRIACR